MTLTIQPIPIMADNYAWFLRDEATGTVAVADAAVVEPVAEFVAAEGGRLDWLLITHHHADHVAGIPALAERYGAKVAGAAADARRLPKLDVALRPGERFMLGASEAVILDSPGHTRGHIAWHFPAGPAVLCGDTMFVAGCGRLLEGDAAEMFASLRALGALPPETLLCCGHEYTLANLRFARHVEPDNTALLDFGERAEALRANNRPTVPTTIGTERAINPFLRAKDVTEFAARRAAKDDFR